MRHDIAKWCAGALFGLLIGAVGAELAARERILKAEITAEDNRQGAANWKQFRSLGLEGYCATISGRETGDAR